MQPKTPSNPHSPSPKHYDVFSAGEGWTFQRPDGQPARSYGTKEAASDAAQSAKECADLLRDAVHLSRVAQHEQHVRLAVIRAGLSVLGRARLDTLKPTAAQRGKIIAGMIGDVLTDDPEWVPPAAYREYVSLLNDMLTLDWDKAINDLSANCDALIVVCGQVLRDDGTSSIACGHEHWQWVASMLAIPESGVGRELDDLMQTSPPTEKLSRLRDVCNRCVFRSHVHLLSNILHDQYLNDLSSRPRVRGEICTAFLQRTEELRESAAEEIGDCRRVVSEVVRCTRPGPALKGGLNRTSVASNFLGFVELGGWDAFTAMASHSRASDRKSTTTSARRSGPKSINYADDRWLSRSVWDAIPLHAGVLPAQGQTRSPRGRRA